jgi:hypothetical protein
VSVRTPLARLLQLHRETRAVAMLEFALVLPVTLTLVLTGAEITNYITTRMRVSQIALQLADNAARMGEGSQLSAKTISEADINDLLTGAGLQSGELSLYTNGRVIISDLEPTSTPNTAATYKIGWQRCRGAKTTHGSTYGTYGVTSGTNKGVGMTGMGPTGRQAIAPDGGATMFVEVYYEYQPLIKTSLAPTTTLVEVASMVVRDQRDLTQIYNTPAVTISGC